MQWLLPGHQDYLWQCNKRKIHVGCAEYMSWKLDTPQTAPKNFYSLQSFAETCACGRVRSFTASPALIAELVSGIPSAGPSLQIEDVEPTNTSRSAARASREDDKIYTQNICFRTKPDNPIHGKPYTKKTTCNVHKSETKFHPPNSVILQVSQKFVSWQGDLPHFCNLMKMAI